MREHRPMNILLVDDEEEICNILEKWLSLKGHKIISVLTGAKAINLIKKEFYNFVFLDIFMPGISGIDLLVKIKKISPRTRVVMITGKFVDSKLQRELRQKGASDVLQKPFKMKDITNITEENG